MIQWDIQRLFWHFAETAFSFNYHAILGNLNNFLFFGVGSYTQPNFSILHPYK